ncbi:MAG: glycosyltransferase [Chloroflexi bacterium]|nr:glycosyltransferase [Chloroflexota bacterium]
MAIRPVGLLLDTVYDNTGDKAIRIAMEEFFQRSGLLYEVLNPLSFGRSHYSRLVIGGGHLIRDEDGGYYDVFRVPGPHVLNTVGVLATRNLDYLRRYEYASVRSAADKQRIEAVVPDAAVVPCVSLAMTPARTDFKVRPGTVGLHLPATALVGCPGVEKALAEFDFPYMLFIPFTPYAHDRRTMEPLAASFPRSQLLDYMDPRELLTITGQLSFLVSSSLHGCMFAYANNVPFLALDTGAGKIAEFLRDRGLEEWLFRNTPELKTKLKQLMESPPDYSGSLRQDKKRLREHFQRLTEVLGPHASYAAVGEAAQDGNGVRLLQEQVRRLREAVRDRDFTAAGRFRELSETLLDRKLREREMVKALAETEAVLAEREETLAEREATLGERESQLAEQHNHIVQLDKRLSETRRKLEAEREQVRVLAGELAAVHREWQRATGSIGYRLLERVRAVIRWLAPPGSLRRGPLRLVHRGIEIIINDGWRAFVWRVPHVWKWPRLLRSGPPAEALPSLDDQYQLWLKAHALTPARLGRLKRRAAELAYRPRVSLVMPVYNPELDWLREAIDSVRGQAYDNWELCIADDCSTLPGVREVLKEYAAADSRIKVTYLPENRGIAGASSAALALASGEFVGLLDNDDELKPDALFEVVRLLNERPDLDFIYSDEDKKDADGRLVEPFFKPDWSPDLLMTVNYVTHFSVFRRELVEAVGGFRPGYDGSQDYDLVLRVTEKTDRIAHIVRPLYTWRKAPGSAAASVDAKGYAYEAARKALGDALCRRGLQGEVVDGPFKGWYRVRYEVQGNPKVSIIIPTKDRVDMLRRCIDGIEEKSTYHNYEIIIIDNNSEEPRSFQYFKKLRRRVVPYPHPFNFAEIVNFGARQAEGDYLLFLNNDTEVISPDWMEALLEQGQRPEVAAVGARLLYPDGRVQHEGIIIGLGGGSAGNVDHGGFFALGESIRNCTAVTGACLLTRPDVFWELNGFDERLRVAFNDVDFCLRALEKGYRIVYTPYALLYHHESATRGRLHPDEDEKLFRSRWGRPGQYRDPFYNPNLDLRRPFTIKV